MCFRHQVVDIDTQAGVAYVTRFQVNMCQLTCCQIHQAMDIHTSTLPREWVANFPKPWLSATVPNTTLPQHTAVFPTGWSTFLSNTLDDFVKIHLGPVHSHNYIWHKSWPLPRSYHYYTVAKLHRTPLPLTLIIKRKKSARILFSPPRASGWLSEYSAKVRSWSAMFHLSSGLKLKQLKVAENAPKWPVQGQNEAIQVARLLLIAINIHADKTPTF